MDIVEKTNRRKRKTHTNSKSTAWVVQIRFGVDCKLDVFSYMYILYTYMDTVY